MLADTAMMTAVLTTAPAGRAIAGLDLKVNFLRRCRRRRRADRAGGGRARGPHARDHAGEVENAEGKPVMLATGTAMYLPGRPASLGPENELSGDEPG